MQIIQDLDSGDKTTCADFRSQETIARIVKEEEDTYR